MIRALAYISPRRLRRLGYTEIPLVFEVIAGYGLYRRLQSRELPELIARMGHASAKPKTDPARLVRAADWFLHPLYGSGRCVPRSLILFRLLRRRGHNPTVVYGLKPEKRDGIAGHAWVLLDGKPFAEWDDPTLKYIETYRYPAQT